MVSEIGIKQYYEYFRSEALKEIKEADIEINRVKPLIAKLHQDILDRRLSFKHNFGVDVSYFKQEFHNVVYDRDSDLLARAKECIETSDNKNVVGLAIKVITYVGLLKTKYEQTQFKNFAIDKLKLTYGQYKSYLDAFYKYGVSKCLLQGYGYRFNYGMGILLIVNYKFNKPRTNVDMEQTLENKKKLIEAGLKPYDAKEAEIAKLRGYKYDGIQYRVVRKIDETDKVILIKSTKRSKGKFKFKASKTDVGLKGYKIREAVELLKDEENIFKLNVGIRTKLLIYKKVVPGCNLKYIRDVKQDGTIRRFNSQDRQRFQS